MKVLRRKMMNSWNESYTKRKQREMAKKSAAYQKSNDPYEYTTHKKPLQGSSEWRQEKERQHRVNIISVVIITLVCIIGVSVILYFATQSS